MAKSTCVCTQFFIGDIIIIIYTYIMFLDEQRA